MEETTADRIRMVNEASSIAAKELHSRGERVTVVSLVIKPVMRFLRVYFCEGAFRSGLPGLEVAATTAFGLFLEAAKLWELEKTSKKQRARKKRNKRPPKSAL